MRQQHRKPGSPHGAHPAGAGRSPREEDGR